MRKILRDGKRIVQGMLWCLLASCLICAVRPMEAVRADVLIELDDSFWEKNRKDCRHSERQYTVNAPEGYAILWESPVSTKQREVVLNGEQISGNWVYTDEKDEVWCAVHGSYSGNGKDSVRGWIKLSDCLVVPDYISFAEAYSQEYVPYDPAYDNAFDGLSTVMLWTYPCSGVVRAGQIGADWFQNAESLGQLFDTCWVDPQGRMWGYIGYLYGVRNTWVCLDDPSGETIPIGENLLVQDGVIYPPADPEASDPEGTDPGETDPTADDPREVLRQEVVIYPPAEHPPKVKNGVSGLAIAGVLGVVAVTILMIWMFFIRKKKE